MNQHIHKESGFSLVETIIALGVLTVGALGMASVFAQGLQATATSPNELLATQKAAEAIETAREAAGGQDVRIGGGATVIRDFLAAGLVDHMHIVLVPILLGRGVRLLDGLEGLEREYRIEATASPSGVTHLTLTRAGV